MEKTIILLLIVLITTIMMRWTFSRARRILESWAEENGYRILSSEIRWFRRGPFFWTTTRNQVVYYVIVRTEDGETKQGWLRCGDRWRGVLRDQAEVRWDE